PQGVRHALEDVLGGLEVLGGLGRVLVLLPGEREHVVYGIREVEVELALKYHLINVAPDVNAVEHYRREAFRQVKGDVPAELPRPLGRLEPALDLRREGGLRHELEVLLVHPAQLLLAEDGPPLLDLREVE